MMKEKMWSLLVHLSMSMWGKKDHLMFDDDFWTYILEESEKTGINTIVLDIGDGIQFASHPEIALPDAWTRKRVRQEVKRCRDLGIELIPKLNFSTGHDHWLGEYHRMTSTSIYYKLCNDLIKECYSLFDHPTYIHLGLDEEDAKHVAGRDLAVFRQKDLYWHDIRFLIDCVADTGAVPFFWGCPIYRHYEEFVRHVDADECVLSPWAYNAFKKEHWTPIETRAEYVAYYNEGEYAKLGIKYVEEDPYLVNFREISPKVCKDGYKLVPCASVFNRCDWNHMELIEYFKDMAADKNIIGFMSAPWVPTLPTEQSKLFYEETFKFFKEAKEMFYK